MVILVGVEPPLLHFLCVLVGQDVGIMSPLIAALQAEDWEGAWQWLGELAAHAVSAPLPGGHRMAAYNALHVAAIRAPPPGHPEWVVDLYKHLVLKVPFHVVMFRAGDGGRLSNCGSGLGAGPGSRLEVPDSAVS